MTAGSKFDKTTALSSEKQYRYTQNHTPRKNPIDEITENKSQESDEEAIVSGKLDIETLTSEKQQPIRRKRA